MATLSAFITRVRERLGEPTEGYWTNAEIRSFINEAARDISRRSESLVTDATLSVVAGTVAYTLPTNVVKLLKPATFTPTGSSARYPLEPVDRANAITRWGISQDINSGTPNMFTITGYAGAYSMLIYPKPSSAGTINYRYAKYTSDLSTTGSQDGSTVDIPGGWEDVAVDYAEYRCWMKRRDRDMAQMARQNYTDGLAGLAEAGNRPVEVPGEITRDPFWWVNEEWGW